MYNSRLLEIFLCLNKKELRELRKFVNSPFHNQRQDVIELFEYLVRTTRNTLPDSLSKEKVFRVLYPKESYEEKKIRYTMSFLFKVIQSFLSYQEFTNDPLLNQKATLQAIRKKRTARLFEKAYLNAQEVLEKSPFRHQSYHLNAYQVQEERYLFNSTQNRSTPLGLAAASKQLDRFYVSNKLKHTALALAHQQVNQSDFSPDFLEEVLQKVEGKKMDWQEPAIVLYYHCVKMLTASDAVPHFMTLRQLLQQHHHQFPLPELREIYTFALNFCIKRLNAREGYFNREAFELYQEGLAQDVFFENGMLSRFNYKNIVALGLGLEEFDWVALFIENYKSKLDKKFRESAYYFNLALLHYKRQNYTEAMELLQKVGTDDVLNNLNARRMLVRIYFDQEQFDPLYSLLDSFQNYIYRKKELGYHRELYLNFIKFTRRLLQKEQYSTPQLAKLQAEIEATKNVAEKNWLLGQLHTR